MGWTIGKYRVEVSENAASWLLLSIDDEPPVTLGSARILGDYPVRIGKRDGIIRRVRNLDAARTELWMDGVCVPHSLDSLIQKLASKGTFCEGAHPESFRTASAPAKYRCPTCRKLLCAKHVAVDRVRCPACFEEAGRHDAQEIQQVRTGTLRFGAAIGIFTALLGAGLGSGQLVAIGAAAALLVWIKAGLGYLQERKEARRRTGD